MKEKILIFIPYQDTDSFLSEGIMTREYAILYILWEQGYNKIINIKKPRTFIDKKRYVIKDDFFPKGTKESTIKQIIDDVKTVQYLPKFSIKQIFKKRIWWIEGYKKTIKLFKLDVEKEYLVYSDNPFAVELLEYLSKKGCKVFFDMMDNFAIHPSLNEREKTAALNCYKEVLEFSDLISANSEQTCKYMSPYTKKEIHLVKNGVFLKNETIEKLNVKEIFEIKEKKAAYKKCVGYIGKLGLRLDADLISSISEQCEDVLFVFVGGYLKNQINKSLIDLFKNRNNILHINAVPSSYIYQIMNEFDILMIPHAIGCHENGGDPLKLYQYLTRNKPIISTPILGVDEFKNNIMISAKENEWVEYINLDHMMINRQNLKGISWDERFKPILNNLDKEIES